MARQSLAVRELRALIKNATDDANRADLVTKLANVTHQEALERGRRRRAKVSKPKQETAPSDVDLNAPFLDDDGTPWSPPSAPAVATPPVVKRAVPVEDKPAPATETEREAPPTGSTRTIEAFAFPVPSWDPLSGRYEVETFPQSSVGRYDVLPTGYDLHQSESETATTYIFQDGELLSTQDIADRQRRDEEAYDAEMRRVYPNWRSR
jgi:hypothetical protein